jgi:hypothetical protein
MDTVTRRRLPDLLGDVFVDGTTLFRSEVRLARAEVSDKIGQAMRGMIMALFGAVLMIPALVILLTALAAWLVEGGMEPAVAAGIVGGGTLLIGLILLSVGMKRLSADSLTPRATIDQLRNDAAMAKDQVQA